MSRATRTRLERSMARALVFVAGVHAVLGFVLFAISGRWVETGDQAFLALVGLAWSLLMAGFAFVAVLVLVDDLERRVLRIWDAISGLHCPHHGRLCTGRSCCCRDRHWRGL